MRFRAVTVLILLIVAAAAQADTAPPEVLSITPSSVPATGGLPVTITGHNFGLPAGFACILPCPTRVRFGETEAVAHLQLADRLVVLAPPHASGTVDLTIVTGDERKATIAKAFSYTSSAEEAWEKILVPVYFEEPLRGGGGAVWTTDFRLRNDGPLPLEIAPATCDTPCPAVYPGRIGVQPNETLTKLPKAGANSGEGRGRVLFATKHLADQLSLQVRIRDASSALFDAGTEIPVVRSRELRSAPIQLLNVPLDPAYRYRLRIYETANVPTSFRVRVWDDEPNIVIGPLLEFTVDTASPLSDPEFRSEPFYAETDLGLVLRGIGGRRSLRVEVTPLARHSQSWAMLTITSANGNHVTTVTPQ